MDKTSHIYIQIQWYPVREVTTQLPACQVHTLLIKEAMVRVERQLMPEQKWRGSVMNAEILLRYPIFDFAANAVLKGSIAKLQSKCKYCYVYFSNSAYNLSSSSD